MMKESVWVRHGARFLCKVVLVDIGGFGCCMCMFLTCSNRQPPPVDSYGFFVGSFSVSDYLFFTSDVFVSTLDFSASIVSSANFILPQLSLDLSAPPSSCLHART